MNNDILTIEEVAAYLRVSERTVYDWAQKGEIPCGRLGSSWRFRKADILEWVDANIPAYRKKPASVQLSRVLFPEQCLLLESVDKTAALDRLVEAHRETAGSSAIHKLKQGILDRENLMSTGLSHGIAVPHVRNGAVKDISVSFAHVRPALTDYETLDNSPVEFVALVLAGKDQHQEHIKLLSDICGRLRKNAVRQKIKTARTNTELFAALIA